MAHTCVCVHTQICKDKRSIQWNRNRNPCPPATQMGNPPGANIIIHFLVHLFWKCSVHAQVFTYISSNSNGSILSRHFCALRFLHLTLERVETAKYSEWTYHVKKKLVFYWWTFILFLRFCHFGKRYSEFPCLLSYVLADLSVE